jgi:hypothetical protein
MQEAMGRRALQQDAYRRGGEAKQAHVQAHRVLRGAELLVLSADYAQLLLFKELQRSWEMTDLHERAGLRMFAFRQGYEGTFVSDTEELARMAVQVVQRRPGKRRAKNRFARSQSS